MSGFRLRSCVWELTLACCFGCRYCGSAGGRARADELSTAECLDTADQLAELGCRRVSLIGGEVFLRRDWAQIAGRLTGRGAAVAVITNGYLMSPEVLAQLWRPAWSPWRCPSTGRRTCMTPDGRRAASAGPWTPWGRW